MTQSQWTHILTPKELDATYALTAELDPSFAAAQREFYAARTVPELETLMHQAWMCSDSTAFQMARSHRAILTHICRAWPS